MCGQKFNKDIKQLLHELHWCDNNPDVVPCRCACNDQHIYRTYESLVLHQNSFCTLNPNPKKYICDWCNKAFKSKSNLSAHQQESCKKKSHKREYTCDQCGKSGITTSRGFKKHKEKTCKPHICSLCHKGFKLKKDLDEHSYECSRLCLAIQVQAPSEKKIEDFDVDALFK